MMRKTGVLSVIDRKFIGVVSTEVWDWDMIFGKKESKFQFQNFKKKIEFEF
jgi:hypothetical protein